LDKQDIQHYTALQIAVWFELPMMIRHIGKDKIRERDVRTSGFTALHLAVNRGSVSVVGCLLEMGADVDVVNNKGSSPLHLAVARYSSQNAKIVLQQLLDASADVNARDGSGCTSLHLAAEKAHDSFIPLLLQHGADIDAVDDCSCSPLHSATKGTEFLFLKTIIKPESLAEVEAETALKYENTMTILLEQGAKLEAVDNKSRTPLHPAADKGLEFILEFLLRRGARRH
jgi:ankyrin repeat protein